MALQKRLFDFVESKRTWLTRLASDDGQREKATELRAQLLAAGTPWVNDAEALAPALICAWDARRAAFCGSGPFASAEELAAHRSGCKFRPCPCPHGCMEVVSAGRLGEHDAACGHKLLPCTQGCGLEIRRKDMAKHCGGNCDRRAVECPFAYLGCSEPVRNSYMICALCLIGADAPSLHGAYSVRWGRVRRTWRRRRRCTCRCWPRRPPRWGARSTRSCPSSPTAPRRFARAAHSTSSSVRAMGVSEWLMPSACVRGHLKCCDPVYQWWLLRLRRRRRSGRQRRSGRHRTRSASCAARRASCGQQRRVRRCN